MEESTLLLESINLEGDSNVYIKDLNVLFVFTMQVSGNTLLQIDAQEILFDIIFVIFKENSQLVMYSTKIFNRNKVALFNGEVSFYNKSQFVLKQNVNLSVTIRLSFFDYSHFKLNGYIHSSIQENLDEENGLFFYDHSTLEIFEYSRIENFSSIVLEDLSKAYFTGDLFIETALFSLYDSSVIIFSTNLTLRVNSRIQFYDNSSATFLNNVTMHIFFPTAIPDDLFSFCLLSFNDHSQVEFSSTTFLSVNSCVEFANYSSSIFPNGSQFEISNGLFFYRGNSSEQEKMKILITSGALFYIYGKQYSTLECQNIIFFSTEYLVRRCCAFYLGSNINFTVNKPSIYEKPLFTVLNGGVSISPSSIYSERCFDILSRSKPYNILNAGSEFLITLADGKLRRYCPENTPKIVNTSVYQNLLFNKEMNLMTDVYCHMNGSVMHTIYFDHRNDFGFSNPHCPYKHNDTYPLLVIAEKSNIVIPNEVDQNLSIHFMQNFLVNVQVQSTRRTKITGNFGVVGKEKMFKVLIPSCLNYIERSATFSYLNSTFIVNCEDVHLPLNDSVYSRVGIGDDNYRVKGFSNIPLVLYITQQTIYTTFRIYKCTQGILLLTNTYIQSVSGKLYDNVYYYNSQLLGDVKHEGKDLQKYYYDKTSGYIECPTNSISC
ncbi:hypothetical protein EIN_494100, partial [Entamoeba invadens IP1]